jgi:hypothetical protein
MGLSRAAEDLLLGNLGHAAEFAENRREPSERAGGRCVVRMWLDAWWGEVGQLLGHRVGREISRRMYVLT